MELPHQGTKKGTVQTLQGSIRPKRRFSSKLENRANVQPCQQGIPGIEVAIAKVARTLKFITTSDLEEILEDLGYYAMPKVPPIKQTSKPDLPFWDASEGKLYFKGKEVRSLQLREKPSNTQQVLEAFQREKWPTEIPHPFGKSPSKAKHAVKYLNEIRTGIEFYARHKGRTLSWKPV